MELAELKALWQAEQEEYRRSEMGTGVQRFVWEMLKSADFFGLSQGLKSTPDHRRKEEFLLEERTKSGQADAVIFVDADVVIPLEVEKFDRASAGEWQILKYRTAYEKKYGILTDGFEWRFYYGDIQDETYYQFNLDSMLRNPQRFRTFWAEYIKPANFYLSFFEKVGQQSFAFQDESRSVDEHRFRFFDDVTDIIRKLKDKLLNAGYFRNVGGEGEDGERKRNKKATEIAYSYLIQFILYKTLVDNGFPSFENEFKTKSDRVHTNLKRGSYNEVLMILEGMSERISRNIYKPFHHEQELILSEVKDLVHSGEENLLSVAPFLDIFVLIKRYNFANVQNDIFGAIYENYLKELYDEQLGQYFTDPEVVNFMLAEVGFTAEAIAARKHADISIVDPSCGSGTFLYSAIREIVKAGSTKTEAGSRQIENEVLTNVFGLDIAEFPLYLAGMSILMRLLPLILNEKYNNPIDKKLRLFVTEDSLAEFISDVGKGEQGELGFEWRYDGFMRDETDLDEMKESLGSRGPKFPRRRFDFVIGNPPYIGYNESSKAVGVKSFRMMKEGSVKLSNIYGWNLHSAPNRRKKYPPKPNLYAFFLALGFALLKDNGRFCYIIPQTVITEPDYDVVRHHLSHDYTIDALLTFAGKLFVGRGTRQKKEVSTSSLIVVCTKKRADANHMVECVRAPVSGGDVRDVLNNLRNKRRTIARMVSQDLLRRNVDNWNFITWDSALTELYVLYKSRSESMAAYYEHRLSERRFGSRFYFDVGFILDRNKEVEEQDGDTWGLVNFKDFVNFTNCRPSKFYPYNETDIALPKNSQGYEALRHKHKLLWEKSRRLKFYYTDADVVPSMSFCQIISSDNKEEILFLFAVLNSSVTRQIFEAMFSIDNEKVGMFVVVSRIKDFIRPPLIDSPAKESTKKRIVELVSLMLSMEHRTVEELVEIDTLIQRFDYVGVRGRNLILTRGDRDIRIPVSSDVGNTIESALRKHFGEEPSLVTEDRAITLAELRKLPALDTDKQKKALAEIDELVLKLYEVPEAIKQRLLGRLQEVSS